MNRMTGYNEDGTINEQEAAAIKHIFSKFNEYSENPPQDMIEQVMEEQRIMGNAEITPEEAAKLVTYSMIMNRITSEANEIMQDGKHVAVYVRKPGVGDDLTQDEQKELIRQQAECFGITIVDDVVVGVRDPFKED